MNLLLLLVSSLVCSANSVQFGTNQRTAAFAASASTTNPRIIQAGDKLPFVDVHWGFPPQFVNMPSYCGGRNVIIVGLPGAFTPT